MMMAKFNCLYGGCLIYILMLVSCTKEIKPNFVEFDPSEEHKLSIGPVTFLDDDYHSIQQSVSLFIPKFAMENEQHVALQHCKNGYTSSQSDYDITDQISYNTYLKSHYILSGFAAVSGNFSSFLTPAELTFECEIPIYLYDDVAASFFQICPYNQLKLFEIPINESDANSSVSILNETNWIEHPVNWKDTLCDPSVSTMVTGSFEITHINRIFAIGLSE